MSTVNAKQNTAAQYLRKGDQGEHIRTIEARLQKLGYDPGRVDGVFDEQTAKAVKAFKKDQPLLRGYAHSALMGPVGQALLRNEAKALNHAPRHVERDLTKHTRAEDRLVRRAARTGIEQGTHSPAVAVVQRHLKAAGYDPKNTGGWFDQRTGAALKAFQQHVGLQPTGVVDNKTWQALSKVTVESDSHVLSRDIMKRARREGNEINASGGYRMDGTNDCWGFVRRAVNDTLAQKGQRALPTNDVGTAAGRRDWDAITDWSKVPVGTPLSTQEGHAWGAQWHGGLFAGMKNGQPMIYDCSGSQDGAYLRPMPPGLFKYFYKPVAKLLD